MQPNEFLRRLPPTIRPLLAAPLQAFQVRPQGRLLKLWYDPDPRIHYEVALYERTQQLELGLHFEADPARNEWLRRQFVARLIELKWALGNGVEVEPWDRGWARVYETHPFAPLDEPRLEEFAPRMAAFIEAVQSMYQEIEDSR
jgi:hypothetical protein